MSGSEQTDPFLTPRTRPLTTTSSSDNINDGVFVPPNPQFSRDSAYGPQASLSSTPRASAIGEPVTNSYYDAPNASNSNNSIPLLDRDGGHGTPQGFAGKEYDTYANDTTAAYGRGAKKSLTKRPIFWAGLIALIIAIALAVVLPVYFVVIKPHVRSSSSPSGASSDNGNGTGNNSSSNGNTNNGGAKVLITGGDGSIVTKEDGTTFVYNNTFGGFCMSLSFVSSPAPDPLLILYSNSSFLFQPSGYQDPANPFADNAQASSWTPPLNQSWTWGVNRVYGYVSPCYPHMTL